MESVPPCQLRMSDGLPARWTPPCQGPFTSCGRPLICLMTNDYPVKSRAGGHGIPMSVCVCMREGFYMLSRGSLFGGFQCEGPPPLGLLSCCSRRRRRRGGGGGGGEVSEETGVIERGQRGRSDTGHQDTHTLWRDLFRRYSIWPLTGLFYSVKGTLCSSGEEIKTYFSIYNFDEFIIQAQKYLFVPWLNKHTVLREK